MSASEVNLRVTGQSSQGGRRYMEDAFIVAYQQTEDNKDLEYAFFGIFDGHGGKEAAQYAKNNLLDNIVCHKRFWQDDDDLILSAIRDGFLSTHMAMWKEVENWPKTASGLPSTAGTTASVAFIRKGKLYTAHVGDSRIVIGLKDEGNDEWQAESLTIDHKPESPLEKKRIIQSGGLVMNKSGVERVVWKRPKPGHEGPILRSTDFEKIPFLAVARSLGDLWSYDYFQQEFAVSPEPDLGVMSLDLNKDKCLILASDGLWNIMSSQAAVHLVQDVEKENGKLITKFGISENIHLTLCNPSKVLVDCALERWNQLRTRADNVSVITVMLDQTKSSECEVLKEQLVLKMNYPRSLPVLDARLRSKSSSPVDFGYSAENSCCEKPEENLENNKTEGCCSGSESLKFCKSTENCSVSCESVAGTSSSIPACSSLDLSFIDSSSDENSPLPESAQSSENAQPCSSGLADRHTSSPLQSCSNFLPEYYTASVSKTSRKSAEAEGIENNGPCPFPRWSKSASGHTSLSKLATWSKVVSHRRMSDPFPHNSLDHEETIQDEGYSLSDDENSNYNAGMYGCSVHMQQLSGLQRDEDISDLCTCPIGNNCSKNSVFSHPSFKVSFDQLFSIKQAIKRKYPGAEISQSFIGSSRRSEKCEGLSSQKRKVEANS